LYGVFGDVRLEKLACSVYRGEQLVNHEAKPFLVPSRGFL